MRQYNIKMTEDQSEESHGISLYRALVLALE